MKINLSVFFLTCLLVGVVVAELRLPGQVQEKKSLANQEGQPQRGGNDDRKKQQPRPVVRRARRPEFRERDWSGIFFKDIFSEGLVGQRPKPGNPTQFGRSESTLAVPSSNASPAGAWSELVDGFVLENEVKRWQQELQTSITTPVKFKTTHNQVGEQFSMLAMWFAIIGQYDQDVRWKEDAASARMTFVKAASNSRNTDIASFNSAKQGSDDLAELVRGGKFPAVPDAKPTFDDWSSVIDRNPIMNRLELSVSQELKQATASENEFKKSSDVVIHEASLIAAMGRILQSPEMLDADDEDYAAYSNQMVQAAFRLKSAARQGDLKEVNAAISQVNQSCAQCHGDYR